MANLATISPIFASVAPIFAEITSIFASVTAILEAIPSAALVSRIAHVFASIPNVFTPIAPILTAIETILDPVAPILTRGLSKCHSRWQQRDEQCGNNNLREPHSRSLPGKRCQVRREGPLTGCPRNGVSLSGAEPCALTGHRLPAPVADDPDVHVLVLHLCRLSLHRANQVLCEPDDGGVAIHLDDEVVEF